MDRRDPEARRNPAAVGKAGKNSVSRQAKLYESLTTKSTTTTLSSRSESEVKVTVQTQNKVSSSVSRPKQPPPPAPKKTRQEISNSPAQ